MADTLVSAVVETVLGILASSVVEEIGGVWGVKDELNKLANTFVTIQLVLQDAEIKQRKNESIQHWLRELKNVACDAENILDRMATEGLLRRLDSERGIHHKLKSFFSSRNQLILRFEMSHEVKGIRGKLDALAEERLKFHLGEGVMANRFGVTLDSRQTCSMVHESEIFGRHEEKEMIIDKLVNVSPDQDIYPCVYTIQGMCGLGKTTLAQMVYNDEMAERHFERRIWVCVSDDFSIQSILKAMIESIDGCGCNISTLDPLQRCLQEKLMGKRFLLVLDDVWNENQRMWDRLREVLRCGSKGSVLMVTTRIEKVSMMMSTIGIHNIEYLSETDSWSLFSQGAFKDEEEGKENLIPIGKAIVKKCGGVPLAIKALGGLMRFKSLESEWLAIKESEIWQLPDDETGILPALRLSYDNLLPQIRQCFSYCGIFVKDYRMEERQLIELWMANGLLCNIDGQTDMELTGRLIFKELVWRSFLQDVHIDDMGNTTCKMHDLMHDLASSVMRHETYTIEHGKVHKVPKTLRHLSFYWSWEVEYNKSVKLKLPIDCSLRSVIVHGGQKYAPRRDWGQYLTSFLSKQRFLRVLDVSDVVIEKLPNLVCQLEQLRYLSMSCRNIKWLPESLTRLQNLQTLKIKYSSHLRELPKRLKVMKNLWCLDLSHFHSLLCTPPRLGELIRLRRLSVFIVGEDESHHIDQLKELNLSGKLSIQGLDKVRNLEDAKRANLLAKKDLTSLTFSWKKGTENNTAQHFEEVLCGLQPHHNLENICIEFYQGSVFPNWMSSTLALKGLKEISLNGCQRCEHLPAFGLLPSLICLTLNWMDCVERLDAELHGHGECSFPVLTSLRILNMPNLEAWVIANSGNHFPCLKSLEIDWCPKLTGLPKLLSLTDLKIRRCNAALFNSTMLLTSLTSLQLIDIREFSVFPQGFLHNNKALKVLEINTSSITSLSNVLDNLCALKTLHLDNCTNLESLPEGLKYLSSLEDLHISGCDGLKSFPATTLESWPSLRSLWFQNCKWLIPFTGSLNRAPALQVLTLYQLPELENLPNWLCGLESLSSIYLCDCEKLKSLPDGFNSLKSLESLVVLECPQLEERCKKPMGEDWPKISDIPYIAIKYEVIQRLDQ